LRHIARISISQLLAISQFSSIVRHGDDIYLPCHFGRDLHSLRGDDSQIPTAGQKRLFVRGGQCGGFMTASLCSDVRGALLPSRSRCHSDRKTRDRNSHRMAAEPVLIHSISPLTCPSLLRRRRAIPAIREFVTNGTTVRFTKSIAPAPLTGRFFPLSQCHYPIFVNKSWQNSLFSTFLKKTPSLLHR
jgi:hypothetical protein